MTGEEKESFVWMLERLEGDWERYSRSPLNMRPNDDRMAEFRCQLNCARRLIGWRERYKQCEAIEGEVSSVVASTTIGANCRVEREWDACGEDVAPNAQRRRDGG